MLLYNKKDSEIDIYHMEPKKEKLKKYREKLLKKQDLIFYELKTNSEDAMKRLVDWADVDIMLINYDNPSQWSHLKPDDKRKKQKKKLKKDGYEQRQIQKDIIKKYINGEYSTLKPTRVYEYICDDVNRTLHKFLKPDNASFISNGQDIWQIKNMMDLPEKLYLLQLLQLEDFEKLIFEDITKQLQLFDINYWKSVKTNDISGMIETGLVSGTIDDTMKKVETTSKILQKVKK